MAKATVTKRVFTGWNEAKIEREIKKIMKKDGWTREHAERYVNGQKGGAAGKIIYGKWKNA